LDGISIKEINLRDLRKCISLVSQETYLFHGSVQENIDIMAQLTQVLKTSLKLQRLRRLINLLNNYQMVIKL